MLETITRFKPLTQYLKNTLRAVASNGQTKTLGDLFIYSFIRLFIFLFILTYILNNYRNIDI